MLKTISKSIHVAMLICYVIYHLVPFFNYSFTAFGYYYNVFHLLATKSAEKERGRDILVVGGHPVGWC